MFCLQITLCVFKPQSTDFQQNLKMLHKVYRKKKNNNNNNNKQSKNKTKQKQKQKQNNKKTIIITLPDMPNDPNHCISHF